MSAGARVAVLDLNRSDDLDSLGEQVTFVQTDVTDEVVVSQALDVAESLGPVRINVNCAAIANAAKSFSIFVGEVAAAVSGHGTDVESVAIGVARLKLRRKRLSIRLRRRADRPEHRGLSNSTGIGRNMRPRGHHRMLDERLANK